MNNESRNSACLRISSKTLSAAEITNILKREPTRAYDKGTPFSSRNPKSRIRKESVWLLESGLESSESLDVHIEKLVLFVEENTDLLKNLLPISYIDIFCGFFSESGQGGFFLDSALLKRLTVLPIDIGFDLHTS